MDKQYDCIGIGSALVDFLIEIEDDKFLEFNLKKGEMHLIDEEQSKDIMEKIKQHKYKVMPGGSAANTLAGVALLGGRCVFTGKVGEDENGRLYADETVKCNIKSNIARSKMITGHAVTFITPDCERTFATHLGAALDLKKHDLLEEDIRQSKILHIEGYQLEDPGLKEASLHAMKIAKDSDTKVSIDLADPGLVKRNLEELRSMVKEYADIVFANEAEAEAFTGKDVEKALEEISEMCNIAIVKIGAKGSWIKKDNEKIFIPSLKVEAVDTTGAGDMYAAGFLYGYSQKYDLERCGKLGSFLAGKVVSQIGARLENLDKKEIERLWG